jgi:Beta-propeller domains of methanol dehydrogenase type
MMMTKHKKTCWGKVFLVLTGLFLFANIGFAQKIPARPNPPRLVNDFANILTDKQERALEQKLVAYNDSTSTQICVVTILSLDGTDSNDFAYQIGEKWGVGTKENNGVVILVKPKTADELGDVSIQVGYGMEPYVTDAINYEIRTKVMIPAFKENNYYKGINDAVDVIIGLASGAYKGKKIGNDSEDDDAYELLAIGIILLFIYIVIRAFNGKGNSGTGGNKGFWKGLLWGILLSNTRGGGGGSSWGGSSGGSWGGSSGGFGGFGGGHFGGGGGSSKW